MLEEKVQRETAKERSLRVPLDYYRRLDVIGRTKWALSLAAAGMGLVYVGWLVVSGPSGHQHASSGPLAAVHAAWERECTACHRDFQPLRPDAVHWTGFWLDATSRREAADKACLRCHAEPPHHMRAKPEEVASCAACHREHQGPGADIARPGDAMCTRCHLKIEQHRAGGSGASPPIADVAGFGLAKAGSKPPHPPFRSLTEDPGNIKFNHWLHLQPGVAMEGAKHKLQLSDLSEPMRDRYARFEDSSGVVTLDCSACHQAADSRSGATSSGEYLPIGYEQHCQACHPLLTRLGPEDEQPTELPHGLTADRLTAVLDGLLLEAERARAAAPPASADESGRLPLIPGKTLGRNLAQKLAEDVLQRRADVAAGVEAMCQKCHYPSGRQKSPGGLADVVPARIPGRWLVHARFDHRAHRHAECRLCHEEAYAFERRERPQVRETGGRLIAEGFFSARDDELVMIAGLETCAGCHGPRRGNQGGARHDCAECHLYHGRDLAFSSSILGQLAGNGPGGRVRVGGTQEIGPGTSDFGSGPWDQGLVTVRSSGGGAWIGLGSCAASACHGDARSGRAPWRSAFHTWLTRDPHARALSVLWTSRAREMTRLLAPREPGGTTAPAMLTEAQHWQAIKERCIACHATPPADASGDDGHAYALGVHCQSCHGPAGGWLHVHYRHGFARERASGFVDTKDLRGRAAVCMPCHVGPGFSFGGAQMVDHDLIAAGHPRLNFEFRAYFESLPAHWDRSADEQRLFGDFHYRTWLAGQVAHAEQSAKLAEFDREHSRSTPDFALLDCFACHHRLAPASWRLARRSRELGSIADLAARPKLPLPAAGPGESAGLPRVERLRLVRSMLLQAAQREVASYDAAVQAYLAAQAVLADISRQPKSATGSAVALLEVSLAKLGEYLAGECYAGREPVNEPATQYESPTAFDPAELVRRIEPAAESLQRLADAENDP